MPVVALCEQTVIAVERGQDAAQQASIKLHGQGLWPCPAATQWRCGGRLAGVKQVVEPRKACLEGCARAREQPAMVGKHPVAKVACAVPAGLQLLLGGVQAQLQLLGEKTINGLLPVIEGCGVWAEQQEVVHIPHIALDAQLMFDELVQWVEVIVGQHLAGEAANGYAMGSAAIVQALVRWDVGQQFARATEGVRRAAGIVEKGAFANL